MFRKDRRILGNYIWISIKTKVKYVCSHELLGLLCFVVGVESAADILYILRALSLMPLMLNVDKDCIDYYTARAKAEI